QFGGNSLGGAPVVSGYQPRFDPRPLEAGYRLGRLRTHRVGHGDDTARRSLPAGEKCGLALFLEGPHLIDEVRVDEQAPVRQQLLLAYDDLDLVDDSDDTHARKCLRGYHDYQAHLFRLGAVGDG